MTNSDSEATLSEAQKDLCRDIRALSDVELLEFLTDIRRMEREQAGQRVEALLLNDKDWKQSPFTGEWGCDCMEYYCACEHFGIERAIVAARGEQE